MDWNECIEKAKFELGITGYCENFNEVVDLAKQFYWEGQSFKQLKEETIYYGKGECKLCLSKYNLTAHHINYSDNCETICVCQKCHTKIHKIQKTFGFVCQMCLKYYDERDKLFELNPQMYNYCQKCFDKLEKVEYWHNNPIYQVDFSKIGSKKYTKTFSNKSKLKITKLKYSEVIKNKTLDSF